MSDLNVSDLKLILFDVDGTLVDSQRMIVGSMVQAFVGLGLEPPSHQAVLAIVGLSLPEAMAVLAADQSEATQAALVAAYKAGFRAQREAEGEAHAPLYPGARATLDALHAVPQYLLGVATGKSLRGLNGMIEAHGLTMFVTRQVADHHPSKPHPSMVQTAMAETGVTAEQTVMIGDTRFDMEMGRAAGVTTIGVSWGYHPAEELQGDYLIHDYSELQPLLRMIWNA